MSAIIRLYATGATFALEKGGRYVQSQPFFTLDHLFSSPEPLKSAALAFEAGIALPHPPAPGALRAPIRSQEVWAAGVTYERSRTARVVESREAGGATFYDKVYDADRPELFFKATPHRVVGPGATVRIRRDAKWSVPEPELTIALSSRGEIFGWTIGNDMSSRDIEGENPLYLPQAKIWDGSAALGPCLVITDTPPESGSAIHLEIRRQGTTAWTGSTTVGRIRRPLVSLAQWLYREASFPAGCYLMTGTGIVPPEDFGLRSGDVIRITLEPAGTLENTVA